MEWIDGLKNRPVADGGIYVLLCPSEEGVSVKLGEYRNGWRSGAETLQAVLYYGAIKAVPEDTEVKAARIREAMEKEAVRQASSEAQQREPNDEPVLDSAADVLGA